MRKGRIGQHREQRGGHQHPERQLAQRVGEQLHGFERGADFHPEGRPTQRPRRPGKAQDADVFHLLVDLPGLLKNVLGRQLGPGRQRREGDVFLLENVVVGVRLGPLAALEGVEAVAGNEGQHAPLLVAQVLVGVGHGHALHNGRNHQRPQQYQQQLGNGIEQGQLGFESHLGQWVNERMGEWVNEPWKHSPIHLLCFVRASCLLQN